MKEFYPVLQHTPLFAGIREEEYEPLLKCLDARVLRAGRDEILLAAGEATFHFGLVLEGRVQILREEYSGDRTIQALLSPGELFAESFAFSTKSSLPLPVTAAAATDCAVLMMDGRRLSAPCASACPFHARLIRNSMGILADKNRFLNRRLGHLSKRSTREKLLSYLWEQASLGGSRSFTIPLDRQGLADYLCVERSAMSATLSKLRDEGLLTYQKNTFTLTGRSPEESL